MTITAVTDIEKFGLECARASKIFWTYLRLVHSWEVRNHQRTWVTALQALADGCLRHPDCLPCPKCEDLEQRWIEWAGEPYLTGFRSMCGKCKTTTKLAIPGWPGSGKSDTAVEFCAFVAGREAQKGKVPTLGYICYSDEVARLRSIAVKDTITGNQIYQLVFPEAKPAKGKPFADTIWFLDRKDRTQKDATFVSAGMGAAIHSHRFGTGIVLDDIHDPKLVKTPGQRNEAWRIYVTSIKTRAQQDSTWQLHVCNRHAEDDLFGRLEKVDPDWVILRTPAENENGESNWPPEQLKDGKWVGISTEALHLEKAIDPIAYTTQYMVLPPSATGELFSVIRHDFPPADSDIIRIVQSWDTASTKQSWSDYYAMVEFWVTKYRWAFIGRVEKKKMHGIEAIGFMEECQKDALKRCPNVKVVIEKAQAGHNLAEFLKYQTGIRPHLQEIGGFGVGSGRRGPRDLESRLEAMDKHFAEGMVRLPQEDGEGRFWCPWLPGLIQDMRGFPNIQHSDVLAALAVGVDYIFPNRSYTYQPTTLVETGWNNW